MYIFEFKHTLTQQDLANIWQNLPPTSMGAAPYYHESDAVEISHEVFNSNKLNLLNGLNQDDNKSDFAFDPNKVEGRTNRSKEIVEELHWMVFKVKKRAIIMIKQLILTMVGSSSLSLQTKIQVSQQLLITGHMITLAWLS